MWWEQDPERATLELIQLRKNYPAVQIVQARLPSKYCPVCQDRGQQHKVHLAVFARMQTPIGAEYPIVMVYPCDFPNRIPAVWPLVALNPRPPTHQFSNGRLCLTANEYNPAVTGCTVLGWTYDFLTCYDTWRLTGTFPPTNYGRHRV